MRLGLLVRLIGSMLFLYRCHQSTALEQSQALLEEVANGLIGYYDKDNSTLEDSRCFHKINSKQIVEFLVDIAVSPSADAVDARVNENPLQRLVGGPCKDASTGYFKAIEVLMNEITIGIPPEQTCSVIMDERCGRSYIRGKPIFDAATASKSGEPGVTGLLYPKPTNFTDLGTISLRWRNNLGRMTRQVLTLRNNGLATALADKLDAQLKTIFRIVITDGSSGASLAEYTDMPGRTVIIEVGARRFLSKLTPQQIISMAGVFDVDSLIKMNLLPGSIRFLACQIGVNAPESCV